MAISSTTQSRSNWFYRVIKSPAKGTWKCLLVGNTSAMIGYHHADYTRIYKLFGCCALLARIYRSRNQGTEGEVAPVVIMTNDPPRDSVLLIPTSLGSAGNYKL